MMEKSEIKMPLVMLATGLVSVAIIAFQLVLMQVLSIMQWYHFAYMVISVALLGFGASGTFLGIYRKELMEKYRLFFPFLLFITGALMSLVIILSNLDPIRFDSYLLFNTASHIWRLILTYLLFFLPFFTGALAIGMTFVKYSGQIGKVYFANLAGSGLGGILVLALIWIFFPQKLSSVIALIPVVGGFIAWTSRPAGFVKIMAVLSIVIILLTFIIPFRIIPSEYKGISKTLLLPEAVVEYQKSSPYGLIQIVSSPALRYAPGTSLLYPQSAPVAKSAFNNGNHVGSILSKPKENEIFVMNYTTMALPYRIKYNHKALIINSATGEQIALALANKAEKITAVEPDYMLTSLLKRKMAKETDSLFFDKSVKIYNSEARSFLLSDTSSYNLIILPSVGSFHGTSGLNAMKTQYNLTIQAFNDMWKKLTDDGLICISCWMDYPVRNPLKITATLTELLDRNDIYKPGNYIAAIRSWNTITFIVKKTPLNSFEIEEIRKFCNEMLFDPVILPDISDSERQQYNQLSDSSLFEDIDKILSPSKEKFLKNHPFRIRPATDKRPYFSQFLRWRSVTRLSQLYGDRALPFFELGYIIVILTLFQVIIIAALLILLPPFLMKRKTIHSSNTLLYFGSIGLGYMFVEIVLIQQFTLYLGHPVYSVAAVISTLLFASGAGSYYSSNISEKGGHFWIYILAISVLMIIYGIILTPVLQSTTSFPLLVKLFITLLVTGVPGFLMGIPFPTGISVISRTDTNEIPWAWAVNGYFSVISSVLAIIISVEAGFTFVLLAASLLYSVTAFISIKMVKS